jgi:hypothetical protein
VIVRYEVRALSFAEILDTAFRLLRNHVVLLIGVGAIVYVPLAMARHWVALRVAAGDTDAVVVGGAIAALVLFALAGVPIVFAALTWALGEVYVGREPGVVSSLRAPLRDLAALVGTSFLYVLIVLGGMVLAGGLSALVAYAAPQHLLLVAVAGGAATVVLGTRLFLSYVVVWPVMLVERRFGMRALHRSRELMQGRRWRALGLTLVAGLLVAVLGGVIQLGVSAVPYVGPIAAGITESLAMAYQTAVTMLLYFDARSRREAFDIEHLAGRVAARGTAPA